MKILVLQGDNTFLVYQRLKEIKSIAKIKEYSIFSLAINKNEINFPSQYSSLFEKKVLYILENGNLFLNKNIENIKKLVNSQKDSFLIIVTEKSLNSKFISLFEGNIKVESFFHPKDIFNFLDSFYPGNSKRCLLWFHKIIKEETSEMVFYLLIKHVRDLYWVKESPSNIPYSSWKVNKLENQSQKFTKILLKFIINKLSKIDMNLKTSGLDLITSIDLLILTKLK